MKEQILKAVCNQLSEFVPFNKGIVPELSVVEDKIVSLCQELLKFKETKFHYVWEPGNPAKVYASPYRMDVIEKLKSKNETQWGLAEYDILCRFAMTTIGDERTFLYALPRLWEKIKNPDFDALNSTSVHLLISKLENLLETVQNEKLTKLTIEIIGYANIFMNLVKIDWEATDLWDYEYNDELFDKEEMQFCKNLGFEYSI